MEMKSKKHSAKWIRFHSILLCILKFFIFVLFVFYFSWFFHFFFLPEIFIYFFLFYDLHPLHIHRMFALMIFHVMFKKKKCSMQRFFMDASVEIYLCDPNENINKNDEHKKWKLNMRKVKERIYVDFCHFRYVASRYWENRAIAFVSERTHNKMKWKQRKNENVTIVVVW